MGERAALGGGRRWRLELPRIRPVSLNDRRHRLDAADDTVQWRQGAQVAARTERVPPLTRPRVTLVSTPPTKRRRDPDNLHPALKACVDGLVDARVIPDDTAEHVLREEVVITPPSGDRLRRWRHVLIITDTQAGPMTPRPRGRRRRLDRARARATYEQALQRINAPGGLPAGQLITDLATQLYDALDELDAIDPLHTDGDNP